ncbi:NAD(P)H-dependent oxidoreductase [Candidatus Saccharibacteria bacterium]|nr:NAD(P)H-dependent oxidoreductase [Candidatus Saccharibacteria bacterium]
MRDERNLVVYFSQMGNTKKFAELIHEQVGGDIKQIETVRNYPEIYDDLANAAKAEKDNNERPEYKDLNLNLDDYDNIFIGYPMWWYTLPMVMYKFFEDYDFSGKTIIPFNTHEGSYDGGTWDTIKSWERDANVLDGLAIRGGDIGVDPDGGTPSDQTETVKSWLNEIGF